MTIRPNSIGLDSGCVYGNRLSALVLSSSSASPLSSTLVKRQAEDLDSSGSSTVDETTSRQMRPPTDSTGVEDEESPLDNSVDSEDEFPAKDSPKEFEDVEVDFARRKAWIVSVSCAS